VSGYCTARSGFSSMSGSVQSRMACGRVMLRMPVPASITVGRCQDAKWRTCKFGVWIVSARSSVHPTPRERRPARIVFRAESRATSRRAITSGFAPLWQRYRIIARCGLGLHLPQAPQTGCIYLRPYDGAGTSPRANAARESISLALVQRPPMLRKARRCGPPIALDFCFG
jgi:hypothetical protein